MKPKTSPQRVSETERGMNGERDGERDGEREGEMETVRKGHG